MSVGYSGTPLYKKLGIDESSVVVLIQAPENYQSLLGEVPTGAKFGTRLSKNVTLVHLFVTRREDLDAQLSKIRNKLHDDVVLWVSWPKKASKVETTVTEDTIRELALPLGFVDIKVCAVSEIWSGLKLVVRKELRKSSKC